MDIMTVFDGIMVIAGLYMAAAGLRMKKSGRIGSVILAEEELGICRDPEGWIAFMYWRETVFGIILALAGASGVANDLFFSTGFWDYMKMALIFSVFCWFYAGLYRARREYL